MKSLEYAMKLCLVTNMKQESFEEYSKMVVKAVKGGVTMVQLRDKHLSKEEYRHRAKLFKKVLLPFKVAFMLNNHVDIAKEIDADGVHIGQRDMDPESARKILGKDKIIGLSIETEYELEIANKMSWVDYVAASAVLPSRTKTDCRRLWGIEGLRGFVENSRHPVMAIGGIKQYNIDQIMQTGINGVAVIGAITDAIDPKEASSQLRQVIDQYNCKIRAVSL
ncbi:MAG: thiamine phosphate synthase [Alphaproteobacteria bacterium]|nr:thiamine phosphate synthase [Alphaproteobacteria bacterium]OJV14129.1 MAG: thiamine-phosphate diphosphorylase [Alphaproteobacteria bacterium 33-17]